MSHRDYQDFIDGHAEEFEAAAEAMTEIVLGILQDRITPQDGEAQLSALEWEMRDRSAQWVASVLPAVVDDATTETDSTLGSTDRATDAGDQLVHLELQKFKLEEALHNIAHQMARDARTQMREGLQIELEELSPGSSV